MLMFFLRCRDTFTGRERIVAKYRLGSQVEHLWADKLDARTQRQLATRTFFNRRYHWYVNYSRV